MTGDVAAPRLHRGGRRAALRREREALPYQIGPPASADTVASLGVEGSSIRVHFHPNEIVTVRIR